MGYVYSVVSIIPMICLGVCKNMYKQCKMHNKYNRDQYDFLRKKQGDYDTTRGEEERGLGDLTLSLLFGVLPFLAHVFLQVIP